MRYFKHLICVILVSILVWSCFPQQAKNVLEQKDTVIITNDATTTNGPAYDDDESN